LQTGPRRCVACGALLAAIALAALACGGADREARLVEIRSQLGAGEPAATLEPLRELLKAQPDDPELNHLYGSALLATGQPELAIWSLRKAADDPERAVDDGMLLAVALLRGGTAEDAVEQVLRVLELAPGRLDAEQLLLRARLEARQHEEVLQDTDRILAQSPGDPHALLARAVALLALDRPDDAEPVMAELAEAVKGLPEGGWDPRMCVASATFAKEKGEPDEAEKLWNRCLEVYPGVDMVVFGAIKFFAERPGEDRSIPILRRALEAEPDHLRFVEALAPRLAAIGQGDEAEQLFRATTRSERNKIQGWFALARYHESRDEVAKARDAMAQGLSLMGEAPATQVAPYADLLIRAGDYDQAEALIDRFESPVMQHLLRGRLLLARGQPAQALAELEEGTRLWPDNSVARWLTGRAAEQLGDYDRALEEYGEAVRNDRENRDAVLSLLRLLEAQGIDGEMLGVLGRYQSDIPAPDPQMLAWTIRVAHRVGARNVLERAIRELGKLPGQRRLLVAELATLRASDEGPAKAIDQIRASKLDLRQPPNGPLLAQLVGYLVAEGRSKQALAEVEAALAAGPDRALLHELRGRALRAGGDASGARQALERALEIEPERATALAELAAMTAEQGNPETALALYDRATRADPEEPAHAWAAIQLVRSHGDGAELDRRLEALLARHGTHLAAANLLALRLIERDPERALALAQRAVRFRGGAEAFATLGRVQLAHGDAAKSVENLGLSLDLRPDSPSTRYWLGMALAATGETERARGELSAALGNGAFPEQEQAQAALARLEAE